MSLAFRASSDSPLVVSVDAHYARVTLIGELDHCSAHLLAEALPALAAAPPGATWTVDAAAVTFCDGGGLAALVRARDRAAADGRRLVLTRASRGVRRLIEVTGTGDLLPVLHPVPPVAG
ncbi:MULTISPECIES: STAS domain-containing protein [unclassified Blastococcus]